MQKYLDHEHDVKHHALRVQSTEQLHPFNVHDLDNAFKAFSKVSIIALLSLVVLSQGQISQFAFRLCNIF